MRNYAYLWQHEKISRKINTYYDTFANSVLPTAKTTLTPFFKTNCDDVIHREMNWEKSHLHIQHKYINMNQRTEIDETRVIVMLKTVKQLKFWSQTKIQKIITK